MNRNVVFCLLFWLFCGLAEGVWGAVILSAFLSALQGGSNTAVGLAEATQGIANVLTAVPSGLIADRCKRQTALFLATCVGLVAVAGFALVLALNFESVWLDDNRYLLLCVCLGLYGAYQGMYSGPVSAIFADSVSTAQRPTYQVYQFVCSLTASMCGPALSIVLFQVWGDDWGMNQLTSVFLVGISMCIVPALLLLGPRDSFSLGSESDSVTRQQAAVAGKSGGGVGGGGSGRRGENGGDAVGDVEQPREPQQHGEEQQVGEGGEVAQGNGSAGEDNEKIANVTHAGGASSSSNNEEEQRPKRACCCINSTKYIPYVMLMSDITIGLGSGMTIKFFPLFFKNEVELSPSAVNGALVDGN
jgi:hypothetical protein